MLQRCVRPDAFSTRDLDRNPLVNCSRLWDDQTASKLLDPHARPDVVSSITDMLQHVSSRSFDAVWSSQSLEDLDAHEVPAALSEFKRVLKPDGFALITSPDLESIAALILEHGLDYIAYT